MSDMMFREPNQIKWLGSRPGHNGEQVLIDIDTAVATELYEVTAAKTFFLTAFSLGVIRNNDSYQELLVRNILDATVIHLAYLGSFTSDPGGSIGMTFTFPLEIPAGYDFYLSSALITRGFIAGWEE